MENKFKESRFIEQIMVVGEGQKFPGALIIPNFNYIKEWANNKKLQIKDNSNSGLINNQEIQARIQVEVDTFNQHYGGFEQIKKYTLLDHEFSVEEGELTPTLKLKRKIILAKYAKEVEQIYTY